MKVTMFKVPKRPPEPQWPEMKIVRIDWEANGVAPSLVRYNFKEGQFQWAVEEDIDLDDVHNNVAEWACIDGDWSTFLFLNTPSDCDRFLKNAPKIMAALGKCF